MTSVIADRTENEKKLLAANTIIYLNELLRLDQKAVTELVENRVECNAQLAWHPTLQSQEVLGGSGYVVGMLGVINGLIGKRQDGWGYITAVFDDHEKLLRFEMTKREGD